VRQGERQSSNRRSLYIARLRVVVFVAVIALPLMGASDASAHAYLVRSVPAYGDALRFAPPSIRLGFDEKISQALSRLTLVGAKSGVIRHVRLVSAGPYALVAQLPPLPHDLYRVEWRAVDADDLHATNGAIVFGVGTAAPALPANSTPSSSRASPSEVLLHWEDFAAVGLLIGALTMVLFVLPGAARRGATRLDIAGRPLWWLGIAGCVAALVSGIGLLVVQTNRVGAASIGGVLVHTGYGNAWIARETILALSTFVLVALRRSPSNRALRVSACLLGVGLVVPLALVSHAAAVNGKLSVATGILGVHILAAGVWVGGVTALCLAVIELIRAGERTTARQVALGFGKLAAVSVALLAISGIAILGIHVRSLEALFTSGYGLALIAKTGLFVLAGALGLATTIGLRLGRAPALLRSNWMRAPRIEAAVLGAVLLPAAFMVSSAPPRKPWSRLVLNPPTAPARSATQVGDLILDLSVEPNRPGRNFISVGVYNVRRPAPAPINSVVLSISRPGIPARTIALRRASGEQWRATVDTLSRPGDWKLATVVRRPGLHDTAYATSWAVSTSFQKLDERGLRRPLEPILRPIAIGAAVLLALILTLSRLRRKWTFSGMRRPRALRPRAAQR
jgi:copper transport protein